MKVKDLIDKLKPLPADILNCLKEMEILKINFTNCRVYFPSMTEENIGKDSNSIWPNKRGKVTKAKEISI